VGPAAHSRGADGREPLTSPSRGTTLTFIAPGGETARLDVYDVAGRRVRRLYHGTPDEGLHEIVWNGRNDQGQPVSSGIYFYRLSAGEVMRTQRLVVVRGNR